MIYLIFINLREILFKLYFFVFGIFLRFFHLMFLGLFYKILIYKLILASFSISNSFIVANV